MALWLDPHWQHIHHCQVAMEGWNLQGEHNGAFLMAQWVKNPSAMQETSVQFLGREDPLEKEQATALQYSWVSLVGQMVKNLPVTQETRV